MGYTHYWSLDEVAQQQVKAKWTNILSDAANFIKREGTLPNGMCIVQREDDDDSPVEFTTERIRLNGVGRNGHETFVFSFVREPYDRQTQPLSGLCKTNAKPYDKIVFGVLAIIKHHAPAMEFRSDGFGISCNTFETYIEPEVVHAIEALARCGFIVTFTPSMEPKVTYQAIYRVGEDSFHLLF